MPPVQINFAKALENLKERVQRLQADGRQRLEAQRLKLKDSKLPNLPRLPNLREKAAQLKLPEIKRPQLKLPDTAASRERLKAAGAEAGRQFNRARENLPRSLGEVAPKARNIAKRITDAVPKRAPAPPDSEAAAPAIPAPQPPPIARDAVAVRARRTTAEQKPILIRMLPLLLALVAGGVIHILATFAVPMLGTGSAWNRLARFVPTANRMTVLAPQSPASQPLPFLAPDMRYAICRYDLSIGPVLVTAMLPDVGWSLTLYSPQGDNFYAVPAQELRQTELSFQIIAASDRLVQLSPGVRKADVDLSQVTSPGREGLVVVRAPIKGIAHQAEAERILRTASCQQSRPN